MDKRLPSAMFECWSGEIVPANRGNFHVNTPSRPFDVFCGKWEKLQLQQKHTILFSISAGRGGRGFQNLLHWTVTAGIVLVDSCSENEILFDGCVYEAFSNSLTKINVCYIKLIDSGARFWLLNDSKSLLEITFSNFNDLLLNVKLQRSKLNLREK